MGKVLMTVEDRGLDYAPILEYLRSEGHECLWQPLTDHSDAALRKAAAGFDAIIAGMEPWNKRVLPALAEGGLKIIARYGIGYNTVDVALARSLDIVVTNTPGILSEAVAELALAYYLCLARAIIDLNCHLHHGIWQAATGNDVKNKTVGLIGFGDIGQRFAKLLQPFSCTILAHDKHFNKQAAEPLGVREASIDEILAQSDCVSLHIPATAQTHNLVNAQFLQKMKPSAFLLNTSRGSIVDEDALIQALRNKTIAGAALDVYVTEPLPEKHHFRDVPNLIITPHIASATAESFLQAGMSAASSVVDCLAGKTPPHVVH